MKLPRWKGRSGPPRQLHLPDFHLPNCRVTGHLHWNTARRNDGHSD